MSRGSASACAVVLAVLSLLGMSAPAHAAGSVLPHLTVHLSRTTVTSGSPVTVTAHANTLCDWIVDFNHERRHTISRSIRTTFIAPEVTRRTRLNVVATCVVHTPPTQPREISAAGSSGSQHDAQGLVVRIPASATVDPPLIVDPGGAVSPPHNGGHHGGLPNTGGPPSWLVLLGCGLVLIGSVVIRRACRR